MALCSCQWLIYFRGTIPSVQGKISRNRFLAISFSFEPCAVIGFVSLIFSPFMRIVRSTFCSCGVYGRRETLPEQRDILRRDYKLLLFASLHEAWFTLAPRNRGSIVLFSDGKSISRTVVTLDKRDP